MRGPLYVSNTFLKCLQSWRVTTGQPMRPEDLLQLQPDREDAAKTAGTVAFQVPPPASACGKSASRTRSCPFQSKIRPLLSAGKTWSAKGHGGSGSRRPSPVWPLRWGPTPPPPCREDVLPPDERRPSPGPRPQTRRSDEMAW